MEKETIFLDISELLESGRPLRIILPKGDTFINLSGVAIEVLAEEAETISSEWNLKLGPPRITPFPGIEGYSNNPNVVEV